MEKLYTEEEMKRLLRRQAKLLLSREEAAERLSMSLAHFERYVQPEIALVRSGRRRLVPVREIERWVRLNAVRL